MSKQEQKQKRQQWENRRLDKPFKITSVCRADLMMMGFSKSRALRATDAQMQRLGEKLANDYCEQLFWSSLEILAEIVLSESKSFHNHKTITT